MDQYLAQKNNIRSLTTTSRGSVIVMRLSSQYSQLPRDLMKAVSMFSKNMNISGIRVGRDCDTYSVQCSAFQSD